MSTVLLISFIGALVLVGLVATVAAVAWRQDHPVPVSSSGGGGTVTPAITRQFAFGVISLTVSSSTVPTPLINGSVTPLALDSSQLPPLTTNSASLSNSFNVDGLNGVPITTLAYTPDFTNVPDGIITLTGTVSAQVRITATTPTLTVQCGVGIFTHPTSSPLAISLKTETIYQFDATPALVLDTVFNFTMPFSLIVVQAAILPGATLDIYPAVLVSQAGCTYSTRAVTTVVNEIPFFIKTPA